MASEVAIGQSVTLNAALYQQLMQARISNSKVSVKIDIVRNERHNIGVLVLREASHSSASGLTTLEYEPTASDSSSSCGPELQY